MEKTNTMDLKLTRGDKIYKKAMDKLNIFKDGLMHGLDSFTLIHKQTLNSCDEYVERISKSQEFERLELYEIIKISEDEIKRKEAFGRLKELDNIREKEIKNHNEFVQMEQDKFYKNIIGICFILAVASGLIPSRQVYQMTGKALDIMNKNFLCIR